MSRLNGARMKQATDLEQTVPQEVVEALRNALGERLIAIVLFGSRARGDHRSESDWDLLVIAEALPDRPFDRRLCLTSALPAGVRGTVSVLAKTPEEFEARLPSIYLDIALDGKILYDLRGYAAERLARLRQVIGQAGLYRERTPAGDMWQWLNPPTGPWSVEWGS